MTYTKIRTKIKNIREVLVEYLLLSKKLEEQSKRGINDIYTYQEILKKEEILREQLINQINKLRDYFEI